VRGSPATPSHDGNSLRVEKVSGGTTTVYIYSGTKMIAEYENGAAPNAPTREYIYSGGALLAKIESGTTTYFHADQLLIRMMTESSNALLSHYPRNRGMRTELKADEARVCG
jgi:hypothetical protein